MNIPTNTKALPLTSTDHAKLIVFGVLMILSIPLFGVGVLPVAFLWIAISLMKKNNDFSYIEIAVTGFKYYFYLVTAGIILGLFINIYMIRSADDLVLFIIPMLMSIGYTIAVTHLFYEPLDSHRDWVINNSIFTNK